MTPSGSSPRLEATGTEPAARGLTDPCGHQPTPNLLLIHSRRPFRKRRRTVTPIDASASKHRAAYAHLML